MKQIKTANYKKLAKAYHPSINRALVKAAIAITYGEDTKITDEHLKEIIQYLNSNYNSSWEHDEVVAVLNNWDFQKCGYCSYIKPSETNDGLEFDEIRGESMCQDCQQEERENQHIGYDLADLNSPEFEQLDYGRDYPSPQQ